MFFNTQIVEFQCVSPTAYLDVTNSSNELQYYIASPVTPITIATLEFKLDTLTGRDTTNTIPWMTVDISGTTDDIYTITVDGTGLDPKATLRLTLRVTDDTGTAILYTDNEVTAI